MKITPSKIVGLLCFSVFSLCLWGAEPETPTWTDPIKALAERPHLKYQGEYLKAGEALQVALVGERFYLSRYQGGLPGAGWDGGAIEGEWLEARQLKKRLKGFRKIDRGAIEGAAPAPAGAMVLFDGSNADEWKNGSVEAGLLAAGAVSKRHFTDFSLHLEYRLPLKPELPLSHPDRGNSGLYIFGNYEVQIIDTFALDFDLSAWEEEPLMKSPKAWCGGLYKHRAANVNMCLPPLVWQSLDIHFTAARFDGEKKLSAARISVIQNGVEIHRDIELPKGTGNGAKKPEQAGGALYIQKHGNPVYYRNIWLVER